MQPFFYFLNFLKTLGIFSGLYLLFYWDYYRIDSPFLWMKQAHIYIVIPFLLFTTVTWLFPKINHWIITLITTCNTSAIALFIKLLLMETGSKESFYLSPLIKISRIWTKEEKIEYLKNLNERDQPLYKLDTEILHQIIEKNESHETIREAYKLFKIDVDKQIELKKQLETPGIGTAILDFFDQHSLTLIKISTVIIVVAASCYVSYSLYSWYTGNYISPNELKSTLTALNTQDLKINQTISTLNTTNNNLSEALNQTNNQIQTLSEAVKSIATTETNTIQTISQMANEINSLKEKYNTTLIQLSQITSLLDGTNFDISDLKTMCNDINLNTEDLNTRMVTNQQNLISFITLVSAKLGIDFKLKINS